jgi:CPA1 family monovalent cation:H+ antiporter
VSASTWSVLLFILNGLVFVILGFSIPDVMKTIFLSDAYHNGLMIGYIFAITLLLIVLRFIWIYLFTHLRDKKERVTFKDILLTSISGVRGAVTLAGAFSIPLTVLDGSAFPGRDLMIFLASGVILLSLLIASIFLPILAKKPQEEMAASPKQAERAARERVIQAGVQILQTAMTEETRESVGAAIEEFKQNAGKLKRESEKGRGKKHLLDSEVRLAGIQAERKELDRLLQAKAVSLATAEKLTELFNHTEVVLARRIDAQFRLSLGEMRRFFGRLFTRDEDRVEGMEAGCNLEELRRAKLATAEAAYETIRNGMTDRNRLASEHILFRYRQIINRLKRHDAAQDFTADILAGKEEQRLSLNREAIQEQRNTVQEMFEDGTISRELAGKLRQFVAELEASLLKEE